MKRFSTLTAAAVMALASGVGVPLQAVASHMFRMSVPKPRRAKNPTTDADFDAIKKAEAKRLRKSNGKNKERV